MASKVTFHLVVRPVISGVFATAACFKLVSPTMTHLAIYQYQLLSWEQSEALASYLPWVELTAAIGLWIPSVQLGAAGLCSGLMLLFLGALASAWGRSIDITCGCFGASNASSQLVPRILEDVFLLGMSLFLYRKALSRVQEQLPIVPDTDN